MKTPAHSQIQKQERDLADGTSWPCRKPNKDRNRPRTTPASTSARYVGRVGGLAVALGIGAALASNPGVALASPESTDSPSADATTAKPTDDNTPDPSHGATPDTKATAVDAPTHGATTVSDRTGGDRTPKSRGVKADRTVADNSQPDTSKADRPADFGGPSPKDGAGPEADSPNLPTQTEPPRPAQAPSAETTAPTDTADAKHDDDSKKKTRPIALADAANSTPAASTVAQRRTPIARAEATLGNPDTKKPDAMLADTPAAAATAMQSDPTTSTLKPTAPGIVPTQAVKPAAPTGAAGAIMSIPRTLVTLATNLLSAITGATAPGMPTAPAANPVDWGVLAWVRRQLNAATTAAVPAAVTTAAAPAATTAAPAVTAAAPTALAAAAPTASAARAITASNAPPADQDATAYLQAQFDALQPGDTLTLERRTYLHSGNLYVTVPNVTINGDYATLQATNENTSAVALLADGVTLTNITLNSPNGATRQDTPYTAGVAFGYNNVALRGVAINGGAGAGVFVYGARNFVMDRVYVTGTAADGILISGGASNGQVNNVIVTATGDDAISVVSYNSDPSVVHDIVVNNPIVVNTAKTRGLVVVGGQRITFNNINVSTTALSGVFIGSQGAPFNTASTSDVLVNGGTITGANWANGVPLGAITVYNDNPTSTVSNVTFQNLRIVNPYTQYFNIANGVMGGAPASSISNIRYQNIAIQENPVRAVFYTNTPGAYTTSNVTINGVPSTTTL